MRSWRLIGVAGLLAVAAGAGACSTTSPAASGTTTTTTTTSTTVAATTTTAGSGRLHWIRLLHVVSILDIAGPGAGGVFTVAADGLLFHLSPAGTLAPFARGPAGYRTPLGPEPYIAFVPPRQPPPSSCPFDAGATMALVTGKRPGVVEIDGAGDARRFADLPAGVAPDGIALDGVGRFGYRLLVTARRGGKTTLFAVNCKGVALAIARDLPPVEGGITVAPAGFGAFGGDLVAPNEDTGIVYAIGPGGAASVLVASGLPHGPDIGVESAGFVPPGFGAGGAAYLSDRVSPRNRHPGTDSLLWIAGSALLAAGVRPGDLLVATEGGAETIVVHCAAACTMRHIADGPAIAHAEGNIAFAQPAIA